MYERALPSDGKRILIDRLWPRGLTKERAAVDTWMRDAAPSDSLRRWFGHDPGRFAEFRNRYRAELTRRLDLLEGLRSDAARGPVTLVYAARDAAHSNAAVLKELLEES